jgi:hypothetical protein
VQSLVANRPFPKLSHKFYGPFTVLECVGNAAYKLELPATSLIHLVFYISQLNPYTSDFTPVFSTLPVTDDFSAVKLELGAILERRLVKKGNAASPQARVKWIGFREASAIWEDWYVLVTKFPSVASCGQDGT